MKMENGILVPETPADLEQIAIDQSPANVLARNRNAKLKDLLNLVQANADIVQMIKSGTLATLTGTQVANYLAAATNNARSLRAQINAAPDQAALDAIDIHSGWPANP